jgi:hypothetical protein
MKKKQLNKTQISCIPKKMGQRYPVGNYPASMAEVIARAIAWEALVFYLRMWCNSRSFMVVCLSIYDGTPQTPPDSEESNGSG